MMYISNNQMHEKGLLKLGVMNLVLKISFITNQQSCIAAKPKLLLLSQKYNVPSVETEGCISTDTPLSSCT